MTSRTPDGISGCVFDAYGTLFDFNSAVAYCRDVLGEKADTLSRVWREKQLQYTWLRSLMGRHNDFWHVTGEALDFAMKSLAVRDEAPENATERYPLKPRSFNCVFSGDSS